MVQRAGAVGERGGHIAEGGAVDRADITERGVGVRRVQQDLADGVESSLDRGVSERDLVGDPLVVGLRAGLTQDEVFDPVRARPAGCIARAESGAPRGAAGLLLDGLRHGEELVPGLGNFDTPLGELGRGVPDEALDAGHQRSAVERVADGAVRLPVGRPELVDVVFNGRGGRLEEVAAGEVGHQAGLREDRDVRGAATLGADGDLGFEFLRRLVLDVDVVLFFPGGPGLFEKLGLGVSDGAVDGHDAVALSSGVGVRAAGTTGTAGQGQTGDRRHGDGCCDSAVE